VVFARSAEVLLRHGCPFKFAVTLNRVEALGHRLCDRGSGGKFITAYPHCGDDELRALAEELHEATEGLPGPGILSDRRYRPGSLVHYRFGVFTGVPTLGNDGVDQAMLVAPDGDLVLDRRRAWFAPPRGHHRIRSSHVCPTFRRNQCPNRYFWTADIVFAR